MSKFLQKMDKLSDGFIGYVIIPGAFVIVSGAFFLIEKVGSSLRDIAAVAGQ